MFIPIYLAFTLGIAEQPCHANRDAGWKTGSSGNGRPALSADGALCAHRALVGVSWLTTTRFKDSLVRLGVVAPTPRGTHRRRRGAALVPAVICWRRRQPHRPRHSTDVRSLDRNRLIIALPNSLGILSIGLAAGIGRRIVFHRAPAMRRCLVLTAARCPAFAATSQASPFPPRSVFLLGRS